jgi:hypothetical protein
MNAFAELTESKLMIGSGAIVVLSSATAIRELLDKRSSSTADRPPNFMAHEITGGLNMALAQYCMSRVPTEVYAWLTVISGRVAEHSESRALDADASSF